MTLVDELIVIGYLAVCLVLGLAFRGRQETARDYFTASGQLGGRFASLLVGLSIAATLFSGISFVGSPSLVFQHGPAAFVHILSIPLSWVVLRYWFLPRYFEHAGATPYQIIRDRIGRRTQVTASVMFVLVRLSWMSALLYAPTLILMAAGSLPESSFWPVVMVTGAICTIYTVFGGIRSVVVTDALQFLVIFFGLLIVVATQLLGVGTAGLRAMADPAHRLWDEPFVLILDFGNPYCAWTLAIGTFVGNLSSYMADQMSLQRYLGLGDAKAANRSFTFNVAGIMAVSALLTAVGLLLRVWYSAHPDPQLPAETDRVLPYFIAHELPSGVTGLLIAAILAATMSSMTSGINALAGCITNDFVAPHLRAQDSRSLLRIGRFTSLLIGIASTGGVALVMHLGAVWQFGFALFGIFLGPLLAIMAMSCLRVCRPSDAAAVAGAIGGFLAGVAVSYAARSNLWMPLAAFACTLAIAYGLSLPAWIRRKTAPLPADT